MDAQRMNEWLAAYAKPMKSANRMVAYATPWKVRDTPIPKETREKPDVVVQYAFGEYGEMDTKDTFSASFWKPR
jgi:hypothetical protein